MSYLDFKVKSVRRSNQVRSSDSNNKAELWLFLCVNASLEKSGFRPRTENRIELLYMIKAKSRGVARILHWGGAQQLSAEGARIEAPKAGRGMGIGEGVSASPTD